MSPATAVSLTREEQDLVARLILSGRFDSVQDVLSAGLRLLEERERQTCSFIERLEQDIDEALASGDATPMEPMVELLAGFRHSNSRENEPDHPH